MVSMEQTVKDFVVSDFRTAAVFEKYHLDFCCGGGLPLAEACRKKGVDPAAVGRDLEAVMATPGEAPSDPAGWELDRLADHIVETHHNYVREAIPVLCQHSAKVARVHGERHPETVEIARLVDQVSAEMMSHMHKEEWILFPYVKELAETRRAGRTPGPSPFGTVRNPIGMMEEEHQAAGDATAEIRRLSNDYTPPQDACTTFRVLYQELARFEQDLHRHVHLENNILFPRAEALERQGAPA